MDVSYAEGDRVIQFRALKELYDIACLLRDNERFVVESVHSRATNEIAAVGMDLAPPQHREQVHGQG